MRKNLLLGLLFAATSIPLIAPSIAAVADNDQTELIEFYNKTLDHYFVTIDPLEISNLDTGFFVGWARTGYKFPVVKIGANVPSTSPVCRFYGRPEAGIDSHFYSSKADECGQVKIKFPQQWQFEADEVLRAFAVDPNTGLCPVDTSPVYRLWNQRPDVNHRYTNQQSVYDAMIAKGHKAEGDGNPLRPVAFCQPIGTSTVPPAAAGTPTCTMAANSATPAVGSTLILTASCTNGPTAFAWTGCTSTSNTCQVTRTTAGAAKYVVTASNAAGPGTPLPINATWTAIGPLPVCSISASNPTPTAGSTLTLSANCSLSPTRIDWLECHSLIQGLCSLIPTCSSSSTSCAISSNTAGFARYAVAGANASGTGPRGAVDVEWKPASGGGAGGGGGGGPVLTPVCSAFASNESPLVNTAIVLFANCANNPTSYSWSGVTCSQGQCSTSSASTGLRTYSVTGSNSAGTSAQSFITVNWGGTPIPQTPACQLTASNRTPTVGQTVVITSSCTNSPSTFAWVGCTSTSANCSDISMAVGSKRYDLTATNGMGSGSAFVIVDWQAAPTAAPVCTVTPPPGTTAFVGQTVTLTASCNNSPQGYTWTNCTSTSSTCVATAATAASVNYTVTASNAIGTSLVPASTTVAWQQSTGGADFCGTNPNVIRVPTTWGQGPIYPNMYGGNFGTNTILVITVDVPANIPTFALTSFAATLGDYGSPPVYAHATLSRNQCDFGPLDATGNNGPFSQGFTSYGSVYGNHGTNMLPGVRYFVNIRWLPPFTCATSCSTLIGFQWPR